MTQRLFEITYLLTRRGAATAAELAERFGVSRRTIYRDIDALSAAGIPVYAEKGKGGGIRMLPDFVLDKTLLSREEQAQLVAHFESLATLGAPDTEPVLDKLAAQFGRGDSWLEVDFAPWAGGEEMRELFRLLRGAILRHHVVRFNYVGLRAAEDGGAPAAREVEPYRVVFRGQGWYLLGYCRLRRAFRYFKFSRMQAAEPTGEIFAPTRTPPSASGSPPGPTVEVVLRFAREAAFRVVDEFPPEQVEPTDDGGFLVRCPLPDGGGWIEGYVLSFGPLAEVLAPEALRRKTAENLAQMARRYPPPEAQD